VTGKRLNGLSMKRSRSMRKKGCEWQVVETSNSSGRVLKIVFRSMDESAARAVFNAYPTVIRAKIGTHSLEVVWASFLPIVGQELKIRRLGDNEKWFSVIVDEIRDNVFFLDC